MANDKPALTIDEFKAALAEMDPNRPMRLTEDKLQDIAVGALHQLRGLQRADKLKVLRRMRKLLDA